jgi:DNA-directed RNA polymerase specialized sigma24 family protein
MEPTSSVSGLIPLLRAEDKSVRDRAASLIWQRYFRELLDLARRNLGTRVRRRVDEEDVVLSMFDSFCARQARGEFDLAGCDELWGLLVTITLRKASNARRNHHRERRDVTREEPPARHGDDSSCPGWAIEQMGASTPSPAEAAVLNEALERRLELLRDAELRDIAIWRLEGYTNREIADRIKRTERSVERRVERIRQKWLSLDDTTG